jgi:copper oxidase (laccase) domain-containing protein
MAAKTAGVMISEYGCSTEHILAAIGPSISQVNYEVDQAVLSQFQDAFSFADELIQPTDELHGKIDLWKANQLQLEEIGLLRNNIEVSEFCTYENVDRFYSHRAEHGITGRNAALLMLK